jgi:hypothetical protein
MTGRFGVQTGSFFVFLHPKTGHFTAFIEYSICQNMAKNARELSNRAVFSVVFKGY